MARARLLLLCIVLVGVPVACGGGDAEELYRLQPTRDCLRAERAIRVSDEVDFVASSALGGALHAEFPGNEVTIAFGRDLADAQQTERAYRRFAPKRINLSHVLRRERNVVLIWGVAPSPENAATVSRCLTA